jgi:hypothetical protein
VGALPLRRRPSHSRWFGGASRCVDTGLCALGAAATPIFQDAPRQSMITPAIRRPVCHWPPPRLEQMTLRARSSTRILSVEKRELLIKLGVRGA